MCKQQEVNFPPSFLVYENENRRVLVPASVIVDQQLKIAIGDDTNCRMKTHVITPVAYEVSGGPVRLGAEQY